MKAHEVVMNWVTSELASGRLHIGDHLPGERALAETLQVSRSSLREALRVLEALGTITTATGSGPRSGTIITAAPEQAFALSLNLELATQRVEHVHVTETRLLLEHWAALHSAPEQVDQAAASALLARMDEPGLSIEEFLALDAEFHATLSRAAGNPLISTLMEALRLAIADHTAMLARALPEWQSTAQRLRSEHRAILAALSGGDGAGAGELLREHIAGYYSETTAAAPLPEAGAHA
ncbi:FadR/GntR family transcriptional regulator [Leucobacter chromiireducens]|uniref:FadR/GntR family transcriptional regulator n=1 Tax=Leucobacter chromiireducens TaxID=283877 RepID=UPI000F632C66|nr:FCD domain-containing protein [Leucobacter chromiireducens]